MKAYLLWRIITFMVFYNVRAEDIISLSQNASWFEAFRNCQHNKSDVICVSESEQSNLTTIGQYLIDNNIQSAWVKNNATINYTTEIIGCCGKNEIKSTANKSGASSCNCNEFCILSGSTFFFSNDNKCFCFNSKNESCRCTDCTNCNGNKIPVKHLDVKVEYCTYIIIRNTSEVCMEQTTSCDETRPVICSEKVSESTRPTCGVELVQQRYKPYNNSLYVCVDLNGQNIGTDQNYPETQTTDTESTWPNVVTDQNNPEPEAKRSGTAQDTLVTVIVPVVSVVMVVVIFTLIMVIIIYRRRKMSKNQTRNSLNISNNVMPNQYESPKYDDSNNKSACEYDYIRESDINQNAKIDNQQTDQYETANGTSYNLGNNYFILEPQNKIEGQMATGNDDDGDYVDKAEGEYHHLNEKSEKKQEATGEDNLYDHGHVNKKDDGMYDTTNVRQDNIDKSEYNTISSVTEDGTYNRLV